MKQYLKSKVPSLSAAILFGVNFLFTNSALAVWNEGQVRKVVVYEQTAAGTATLADDAYRLVVNIRDSWNTNNLTGAVYLPNDALWWENPLTVVTPSSLYGAHYQYEAAFATWNDLNAAFPNGIYTFAVERVYANGTTTFNLPVQSTVSATPPSAAPVVQSGNWSGGTLLLNPADARIYYTATGGVQFGWELTGAGSAGGMSSSSLGVLNLTGIIGFGQTVHMEFRHLTISGSQTTTDPYYFNPSEEQTFYASEETVVRFDISTPSAADNFKILAASYSTDGKSWDVKPFLDSMMNRDFSGGNWNWFQNQSDDDNALIWRVEERDLTNNEYWGWSNDRIGTLHIAYQNDDGLFEGNLIYDWDLWRHLQNDDGLWDYYLVLPNPLLAIPEPSAWTLTVTGLLTLALMMRILPTGTVNRNNKNMR